MVSSKEGNSNKLGGDKKKKIKIDKQASQATQESFGIMKTAESSGRQKSFINAAEGNKDNLPDDLMVILV